MKFKFLLLMALSALLWMGCSTEADDDLIDGSSTTEFTLNDANTLAVARPFKSKAAGDWYWVASTDCDGMLQYTIAGTGNATHMGLITVEGTLCAYPPAGLYFITVTYTAANGDFIMMQSEEIFLNEDGLFAGGVFNFVSGSGRFSDVEGSIEVNEILLVSEIDPDTGIPLAGTFSNTGLGNIRY